MAGRVNVGTSGTSGYYGTSGSSGHSGTSGTSGSSGSSGISGTSGTGGIAWGTVNYWNNPPPSTTLAFDTTNSLWSGFISGSSMTTSTVSSYSTPKSGSVALNVNNMKGIDFRKQVRSKRVSACECI